MGHLNSSAISLLYNFFGGRLSISVASRYYVHLAVGAGLLPHNPHLKTLAVEVVPTLELIYCVPSVEVAYANGTGKIVIVFEVLLCN